MLGETPKTPEALTGRKNNTVSKRKRFEIRLTEKEYAQLKEKASIAGVRRATLLRNYISDKPIVDGEVAEELRRLRVEISRIGNNINQIAKRWNESGSDMKDLSFMDEQLGEIIRCVNEVRTYCYSTHSRKRR